MGHICLSGSGNHHLPALHRRWSGATATVDVHGVLRVGNTRVTLDTVLAAFADGATAEEIVRQYPSLHLTNVYSVIGYYLRHTTEVDVYIQQRHRQRETVGRLG
jgi:uncharacterized protein (DUF433 family)